LKIIKRFDGVYDDDLPGFLAVKTHFWDKGQPDVEVFLRRRTFGGDWVWIVSKVISNIDEPIPGMIVEECRVFDEELAQRVNRITKIAAVLVQAVEAAQLPATRHGGDDEDDSIHSRRKSNPAALEAKLNITSMTNGNELSNAQDLTQSFMQYTTRSNSNISVDPLTEPRTGETSDGQQKKRFDPMSMMEEVRNGVRVDLGMVRLSREEVDMIVFVLTGQISVAQLCPIVLRALKTGEGLGFALRSFISKSDNQGQSDQNMMDSIRMPLHASIEPGLAAPAIAVLNVSYTYIGNWGMEIISESLIADNLHIRTLDVSFCGIHEKGFVRFARALTKRKRKRLESLRGLILSGNYISYRAAVDLGVALSPEEDRAKSRKRSKVANRRSSTGYDEDDESDDDDGAADDYPFDDLLNHKRSRELATQNDVIVSKDRGLKLLHIASASLTPEAMHQFLVGLGGNCPVCELSLASNHIGRAGAGLLVAFLETKIASKNHPVMPYLDRLDLSNNDLGNDGTAKLARAISKRVNFHLVDLRLSSNSIGTGGVETIMNKLLQHNLISLSLDKNSIGDQGCQLVAASLQSMPVLSRLNLSFNQIGSRGVNSLMRTLVGCDSIIYLGLSGNIMKISGAIALAFTLAQHPRLEELDVDNCCLSQSSQCHITAGIISNRWVPMKQLNGFHVGPPMVAIGALDLARQNLSNEECFRIRKDEQMKTILQWMEINRIHLEGRVPIEFSESATQQQFLTPELVSRINDVQGMPSQSAYLRMLGWLSRIPFDEEELLSLRKYFFDADGGESDRGSDGYINLKVRGDLLAALDSEVADEIRYAEPLYEVDNKSPVGLDLEAEVVETESSWGELRGEFPEEQPFEEDEYMVAVDVPLNPPVRAEHRNKSMVSAGSENDYSDTGTDGVNSKGHLSDLSSDPLTIEGKNTSTGQSSKKRKKKGRLKPRITMFPQFQAKLDDLKVTATELIERETDQEVQDVILTQYAEACLTILRQLRYHCINSGLDGWRQSGLKRKVLIIDDSMVTRKLVARAFQKANFIVDTAVNGAQGVEKLKQSIYDIAFMDIDMPVMNGFDATKELRKWEDTCRPGARQPICALTAAYVDDFERSELMKFKEAGLDVMESKPCNIPRLFKVVDDVSPMFSDLSISVTKKDGGSRTL
jgi:CheY-like chemotaxis protein/Ran GTPase-activating protein (RanGAP) involved in mRNA processing and transport